MLYLTGSVALGDYQHGNSDIDFLAVTSRCLGADDLATVATVHAGLPTGPHYDGIYLGHASLNTMPDNEQVVPHAVNGMFHADQPCGELNPVLWLMLTRHGITVRGPQPADLRLRVQPERLRRWNLDNLKMYWHPLARQIRQAMAGRADHTQANAVGVAWAVLGPARLHYTLATGDVASKSAAATYAAERFPAWADLAGRAVRWREGSNEAFTTTDAIAAAAMVDAIVDDAWRRWG